MAANKLKLDIKSLVKKLDISTKTLTTSGLMGGYKTSFKGTGLEFEEFRRYNIGDDASLIDWRASVKSDDLLIKTFNEERSLDVFFLLDVSNSMLFGSTNKLKCQYAAEVVASMAFAVMNSDDNIGLGMFSNKMITRIYPNAGEKQYYSVLNQLVDLNLYGGEYDLGEALKFIVPFLQRSSILIIVSDFIGLKGEWKKYLKMACSKFDVIAIMIKDPRDRELPMDVGDIVISSPYSQEKITIKPEMLKEEYETYVREEEKQLEFIFENNMADFLLLTTDKPFVTPIVKLFKKRSLKFR